MSTFLVLLMFGFLILSLTHICKLNRKIDKLTFLATRDPLTGLLNRRGGSEILEHHHTFLVRSKSAKNNFAVLNLDLNRFKGINDKYGHETGDLVLKFFGEILTKKLRGHEHDIIVRAGGDEFLVILPGATLDQAKTVKQKIKNLLHEEPFKGNGLTLILYSSIGIAMAMTEEGEILPLGEILKLADVDMYIDKDIEHKTGSLMSERRAL